MPNDFFNASGTPVQGSQLVTPAMRAEFAAIAAAFDRLPTITGNAYKIVYVNASGSAMAAVGGNGLLKINTTGIPSIAVANTDYVVSVDAAITAALAAAIADADHVPFVQTSVLGALKKITWANVKAALAVVFVSKSGGNLTGGINEARGSVAMHATTMDLWAQPNIIDGTSAAATITAIANAPQAGARRVLYPVANSIITNGATFAVDGAANATAAAGDAWEFEAITVSTFKVHVTKKDGTAVVANTGVGYGQCRLTKSGANLLLKPCGGNLLTINGTPQIVPDAGVTLAPTGLTAGFYYIYAYMSGATMTLEASTTARATSTTAGNKGVEIKSGDDSRTLVGAAYSTTSSFTDQLNSRSVISWFNRRNVTGRYFLTTNRTTTSTSIAEINAEARVYFLTWSDEAVHATANGSASNSTAFQDTQMAIGWDGVSVLGGVSKQANTTATSINSLAATSISDAGTLTEAAIHYVVLGGAVSANTGTYAGGADNTSRCEINILIRG